MSNSESSVAGGPIGLSETNDSMMQFFQRELGAGGHLVIDQYGNRLQITDEIARGGQGVVYRTADADLAIKQPVGPNGRPIKGGDLQPVFERIRCLPLPKNLPVSLPVSILRSEPGYVMTLLNEMRPFTSFYIDGEERTRLGKEPMQKMESVDLTRFRLKNIKDIEDPHKNDNTVEITDIENTNRNEDLLSELETLI